MKNTNRKNLYTITDLQNLVAGKKPQLEAAAQKEFQQMVQHEIDKERKSKEEVSVYNYCRKKLGNDMELPEFTRDLVAYEAETITNRWSGESVNLDGYMVALYDYIHGTEMVGGDSYDAKELFRSLDSSAYMSLLD